MHPRRAILRFSILVAVLYALMVVPMMVPWGGARQAYGAVFRTVGDIVFARYWFWSAGHVRFFDLHSENLFEEIDDATPGVLPPSFEPPAPTGEKDVVMVLMNRGTPGKFGLLRLSSRITGYWPAAWLVALILAKPMPRPRKGWALFWGLLLVHAFIALRVTVTLASAGFAAEKSYALFHPNEFWRDMLARADTVLLTNPTVSYVVPTFIWLLVAVKWSEWTSLRESLSLGDDVDAW